MKKLSNYPFMISCIILSILVEFCLLREQIGISYLVFITVFYTFFFYLYRTFSFTHKRISVLLFTIICTLSFTFFAYSNSFFNSLNTLLIPFLVFCHTVLITSYRHIEWNSRSFLELLARKVEQTSRCFKLNVRFSGRKLKRNVGESTYKTGKKIMLGILISAPILVVVTFLLLVADEKFANLFFSIPETLLHLDLSYLSRIGIIALFTVFFYCFLKVLGKKTNVIVRSSKEKNNWDNIIVTTVLLLVNLIYLLFTVVQFQYFFSGTLEPSLSYSEYARRGFFELMLVTLINYVILMGTITYMKKSKMPVVKILLTFLIIFSGVMLTSAFYRLMMYEQAYGYTISRLFAHSFMIYLAIVFSFTLIKVWADRLKLSHFYLIFTLIFYVGMNVIGLDKMIVTNNIDRYEETGKIDVEYLGSLSYSAIPDLVQLYDKHPGIPGLEMLLLDKKRELSGDISWQSYNLSRVKAQQAIADIN